MKTPKEYTDNLKNGNVTFDLIMNGIDLKKA